MDLGGRVGALRPGGGAEDLDGAPSRTRSARPTLIGPGGAGWAAARQHPCRVRSTKIRAGSSWS